MATTGTRTSNPEFAALVDEAFERAGIDPADVGGRHIRSAAFSAQLLLDDWMTRGVKQWTLTSYSLTLIASTASYTLPTGAWDIFHATFKDSDNLENEMYPISRSDYNSLHDKTVTGGRPDRYFVDTSTFEGDAPASTLYLWPVPNTTAATGTMEMWYIRRIDDAGQATATANVDIPPLWREAFVAGLAAKLAQKYNLDRYQMLLADYLGNNPSRMDSHMPGGALGRAIDADREKAPTTVSVRWDGRIGNRAKRY